MLMGIVLLKEENRKVYSCLLGTEGEFFEKRGKGPAKRGKGRISRVN